MADFSNWLTGPTVEPRATVTPGPSPEPQANAFQDWLNPEPVDIRPALSATVGSSPDEEAKRRRLSDKSGITPEGVAAAPDIVENQVRANDIDAATANSPETRKFLANTANAAVAHDSAEDLTKIEGIWSGRALAERAAAGRSGQVDQEEANASTDLLFRAPAAGALATIGTTLSGIGEIQNIILSPLDSLYGLVGLGKADVSERLRSKGANDLADALESGPFVQAGDAIVKASETIGVPEERRTLATDVTGGLGQVGAQLAAAVLTGGVAAATPFLFAQGVGQQRQTILEETGDNSGVNAKLAELFGGAATAVTEKFGLENLLSRIPAATKNWALRVLGGMASEAAQEVAENFLQDLSIYALVDPNHPVIKDIVGTAETSGLVGGIVSAIIPGKHIQTAAENQEKLDKTAQAAKASPLAERDPAALAGHVATVMSKAGAKDVFIPASKLVEVFGADVLEKTGISFRTMQRALTLGGDVRFNLKDFGQYIALSDQYAALKDDIRVNADGLTTNEAKDIDHTEIKGMIKEVLGTRVTESEQPSKVPPEITAEMKVKLAEAGFSGKEIAGMAYEDASDLLASEPTTATATETKDNVKLSEFSTGLNALFETADEAGLTPSQYEAYLAAVENASSRSVRRMQRKIATEKLKQDTAEWKDARKQERVTVAEAVNSRPVYAAWNGIGRDRLDRNALLELFPAELRYDNKTGVNKEVSAEENLAALNLPKQGGRQIFTNKGEKGIDPEVYARTHGFQDAYAMLQHFMDMKSADEVIDAETDQVMQDKYNDLGTRIQRLQSAIEATHHDQQADVIAFELNTMRADKKAGKVKAAQVRRLAAEKFNDFLVREVDPQRFVNQERKEGKAAGKHIRGGGMTVQPDGTKVKNKPNRGEAIAAKFRQLVNFQFVREAYDFQRQQEKQIKFLKKFLKESKKWPNVDADAIDKIKALLGQYNLAPTKDETVLKNWMAKSAKEQGMVFNAAAQRAAGLKIDYRDMTVGQWRDLYEAVENIYAQGIEAKKVLRGVKKVLFDDLRVELLAATDLLPDTGRSTRQRVMQNPGSLTPQQAKEAGLAVKDAVASRFDKATGVLAGVDAAIVKVENLLVALDQKMGGVWHQSLFQPIAQAQTAQLDLMHDSFNPLFKSLEKLPKETKAAMKKRIFVKGLGRSFRRSDLLMIALNVGNVSNYEKLLEGYNGENDNNSHPWTPDGVKEAISHLTAEEAHWVQQVWDTFEKLYPQVEAIHRAEFGISPVKIQAREVTIAGVKLKGGYYPLVYDNSREATSREPRIETALQAFQTPEFEASVFSGMTQTRTNYKAPVLLDLSGALQSFHRVAHYITHYETVRSTQKIMRDPMLRSAIRTKLGPEYMDELDAWLRHVATSGMERVDLRRWNKVSDFFRTNITAAVMGASFTSTASQTLGFTSSVAVLGAKGDGSFSVKGTGTKWMSVGLAKYAANPTGTIREAINLSGEIRHRLRNTDREVSQALQKLAGKRGLLAQQQQAALMMVGGMQFYSVDVPTWTAGYNKGLAEGRSQDDAVAYADSVLRLSQGTGHAKDLSALQREPGLMRIVTMFSSYNFVLYNLQRDTLKGGAKELKNVPGAIARFGWIVTIPALLSALLRQQWPNDDDEQGPLQYAMLQTLAYSLGAIPIAGQYIQSQIQGYDGRLSPVESLGTDMKNAWNATGDYINGDVEALEVVRKDMRAAMIFLGVGGAMQIDRFMRALEDYDDASWYDFVVGPNH